MLDSTHKSSDNRGMNKLPLEKRVQILNMMVEGSSMRAISRVADVSINTVFGSAWHSTRFRSGHVVVANTKIACYRLGLHIFGRYSSDAD